MHVAGPVGQVAFRILKPGWVGGTFSTSPCCAPAGEPRLLPGMCAQPMAQEHAQAQERTGGCSAGGSPSSAACGEASPAWCPRQASSINDSVSSSFAFQAGQGAGEGVHACSHMGYMRS